MAHPPKNGVNAKDEFDEGEIGFGVAFFVSAVANGGLSWLFWKFKKVKPILKFFFNFLKKILKQFFLKDAKNDSLKFSHDINALVT